MDRKEEFERIEKLIEVLGPCLKKSKRPDWTSKRYYTTWGTKTDEGLKAVIHRIIFEDGKMIY